MQKPIIKSTNYSFPEQSELYHGKVRDVYSIGAEKLVMIATDRISAFDHILPRAIPYKGQVLNQLASLFLEKTKDIVPNWVLSTPDPNVTIGKRCEPIKIEMVIRAYLCGHAWREYKAGKRSICGVPMKEGMVENQAFDEPIITPATKAEEVHDEDISRAEILAQGVVSEADYVKLEQYSRKLFARGTELAKQQGLILVDTKYEFGKVGDEIYLIDEIHTPDSSRYFYAEGYEERLKKGEKQQQLSKEFVREWLMENGFQGKEGETMPEMPEEFIELVSERYIKLYEQLSGEKFQKQAAAEDPLVRIERNILSALK
jgi:phosphoribosylaminoimidazole-succinocarboxamide synthase